MAEKNVFDKAIPYIKRWFFSSLLLIPAWTMLEQYWMALSTNILLAVNYPYPLFVRPLFFVIDNVDLMIHEGGHTIFGFFGWRFLTILGGSLMTWLIPFLLFLTAWHKKQRIVAQMSLFFLSNAWFGAAAYCADAYWRDLPLIGNLPKSAHDYYNMLTALGWLENYRTVAWVMYSIGFFILILCLVWPIFEKEEKRIFDLDKELKRTGLL